MQKKAILINGPPGSGKDTAAVIIRNYLDNRTSIGKLVPHRATCIKFADPLKSAAHVLFGIPYSADYYEKNVGYNWKNEKQMEFYGHSPRSIYIALSEDFAKKFGGQSVFGKVAARRIGLDKQNNTFIFSDSGFADEAVPIIGALGIDNIYIIELERPDCSFDGDSRRYILNDLNSRYNNKVKGIRLRNNQDRMIFRIMLQAIANDWFKIEKDEDANS